MLNFLKTILVWSALLSGGFFDYKFIGTPLVCLAVIIFYESLRDGGWEIIKDIYEWLIRLFARPVVNHYETREMNYKDIIFKLEQQLYQKRVALGEEKKIHPSGSCWGLSQELNEFLAEETKK